MYQETANQLMSEITDLLSDLVGAVGSRGRGDRDRETLEQFLETGFHISVPMAGGKCDITPDHEVVFAAIRSLLERLEAAERERDNWKATVEDEVGENLQIFDLLGIMPDIEKGEASCAALHRAIVAKVEENEQQAKLMQEIDQHRERLVEEIERLRATLQGIAEAKPSEWDPRVRDQFKPWAQSRARAALKGEGE